MIIKSSLWQLYCDLWLLALLEPAACGCATSTEISRRLEMPTALFETETTIWYMSHATQGSLLVVASILNAISVTEQLMRAGVYADDKF
jgi:hypothetical protein